MAKNIFGLVHTMLDDSGALEPGGTIEVYDAGTTTPRTVYSDRGLTTTAGYQITADAAGRLPERWIADAAVIKLVYKDSAGATLATRDYANDNSDAAGFGAGWSTALEAALGSNWTSALALATGQALTSIFRGIVCKDTYALMQAMTVADGLVAGAVVWTLGRTASGDGGFGPWEVIAGTALTANGGTILTHSSLSFQFRRMNDGEFYAEWFGSSADWGAALTAAFTACASAGGVVKSRPGGDYTYTTQASCPATENNITWDIRGAKHRPKYASGATFKIGDGVTQMQEFTILGGSSIIDADSVAGGGVAQPVFEFRGVRSVRMQDVRGSNWYQIAKWGDPSDAVSCFNFWIDRCDIIMRTNANGGHSHGILANGGAGGLYFGQGTSIEADADGMAGAVYLVHLTSAQGPARLDHLVYTGGAIFKNWDRVTSAVNARIVNLESDQTVRFDEALDAAHYIEAASGAAKGGCEIIRLAGNLGSDGSTRTGNFLRIKADDNLVFRSILVEDVSHDRPGGASIHITTSGSGVVNSAHIKGFHIANADPSSGSQRAIILDGDIDEALVDGWTIQHKTGATAYEYGVYNNTASTKSVRITKNFTMDTYGTGVVYDPNIGDISINRWCEIRQDGTPRVAHTFTFHYANAAAGLSNALVGVEGAASIATQVTAPARGRVIGNDFALNGTITTDTMTIGLSQSSVISTNFDQAFTSASGANPRAVVDYMAGSSAYAAGDAIELRVTTTAGTFAPTTIDFWANVRFLEM